MGGATAMTTAFGSFEGGGSAGFGMGSFAYNAFGSRNTAESLPSPLVPGIYVVAQTSTGTRLIGFEPNTLNVVLSIPFATPTISYGGLAFGNDQDGARGITYGNRRFDRPDSYLGLITYDPPIADSYGQRLGLNTRHYNSALETNLWGWVTVLINGVQSEFESSSAIVRTYLEDYRVKLSNGRAERTGRIDLFPTPGTFPGLSRYSVPPMPATTDGAVLSQWVFDVFGQVGPPPGWPPDANVSFVSSRPNPDAYLKLPVTAFGIINDEGATGYTIRDGGVWYIVHGNTRVATDRSAELRGFYGALNWGIYLRGQNLEPTQRIWLQGLFSGGVDLPGVVDGHTITALASNFGRYFVT